MPAVESPRSRGVGFCGLSWTVTRRGQLQPVDFAGLRTGLLDSGGVELLNIV